MTELVSPCCGAEYTDNDDGPSDCCDALIINDRCSDRDCLEYAEPVEGFICNSCENFFEEPEKDYEYAEQQHDAYLEDRMEAERDES